MTLLTLLLVAAVLSVYLFVSEARNSDGSLADKNTYAFLEGRVGLDSPTNEVANSNIATNFQLLSVYPNIVFGMIGNFAVPIINALSYFFGSWLLRRSAYRFKHLIESSDNTLHGFIARVHGVPRLKRYTTLISLGAFSAVIAFEVVFLARILTSVMGGNQILYYTFVFGFVLFLSLAVYTGGQRTSLVADNVHLCLSYFGIHICLVMLLRLVSEKNISSDSILLLIGFGTLVMIILRIRLLFLKSKIYVRIFNVIIILSAGSLFWQILLTLQPHYFYLQDAHQKWLSSSSASWSIWTVMMLAAIFPAIFSNFTDFSFWHRLRALTLDASAHEEASKKKLSEVLRLFIVESPLTWLLPLAIGSLATIAFPVVRDILISEGGGDPVAAVMQQMLNASSVVTNVVGLLLMISLVSVAVSTVDSYLASLSYLYAKDMAQTGKAESQNVAAGRFFQIFVGIGVVFVFVILDIFIQKTDLLIALFLTMFAPLAALSPLVVWPLLSGKCYNASSVASRRLLILACVGSSLLGLAIGVFAVFNQTTPESMIYWLPVPSAFLCSWFFYLLFLLIQKRIK